MRDLECYQIVAHVPLGSLDINWKTISQFAMRQDGSHLFFYWNGRVGPGSTNIQYTTHILIQVSIPQHFDFSCDVSADKQQICDTLCDWVEAGLQQTAQIWGCEKSKRCLMIRKNVFEQFWPVTSPNCDLDCLVLCGV